MAIVLVRDREYRHCDNADWVNPAASGINKDKGLISRSSLSLSLAGEFGDRLFDLFQRGLDHAVAAAR